MEQTEAVTGKKTLSDFRSTINAQTERLPEVYQALETKKWREWEAEQKERELELAKRAQKASEKQSKWSSILSGGAAILAGVALL